MRRALLLTATLAAAPMLTLAAQADDPHVLERDILKQLIEINTSDSAGHTRDAAEALARRLLDTGFPAADVQILGYEPKHQSLVARYRGRSSSAKPVLLMAHLDVVDARKEDWSFDPYQFRELDGYYYGRGSSDNKAGAAMLIANFIRYKREGFVPDRDLVIVLTADEETTSQSIKWLLEQHRDLIDAEFALNTDGGGGELRDGKPVAFQVQTAEKVYLSFMLEVRNKGGHSSVPEPDNAIYRLSAGLGRLAAFNFPVRLNETTRAFFSRAAATQPKAIAADMRAVARSADPGAARRLSAVPYYNSLLRTTCVATRLFAGHADNALPQLARATVNCRMLPNDPADSVEAVLRKVLADTAIHLSRIAPPVPSPPSPLSPAVIRPVEQLALRMWPGVAVVPEMSTGATDGLYTRNAGIPTYGIGAIFERVDDIRAHGRDERVGVKAFHEAARYWYELVKALASPAPGA
ncbi:MAG TPA: M20/M25/M40 family metallo-hydrolase [Gemmatimonadales bacterium]|nr:M20/M25/M40 family metallo-hydrolase [Gemmatimonadales bacterium]